MPVVAPIISGRHTRFCCLGKKIQAAMGSVAQVANEAVNGQRRCILMAARTMSAAAGAGE